MRHPAELMHGSTIEIQCPAGHRTWLPLEVLHLVCVCGSPGQRTGRMKLSAQAGKELCGTRSSPRLRASMDTSDTYRLHLDIPELGKFHLD